MSDDRGPGWWDERYGGRELLWRADPNRFVVAEVEGLAPGRALDVACGEGRNAVWLASQGWETTAVDFSPVGLAKARRLAESVGVEVDWVEADVTRYSAAATFDLVLVAYLQIPHAGLARALERAAAAVAPGGTIVVVAHHRNNLTAGYGGPSDPAMLATEDEVAAMLTDLVVEKAEQVERVVATDDGEAVALDLVVRARRSA